MYHILALTSAKSLKHNSPSYFSLQTWSYFALSTACTAVLQTNVQKAQNEKLQGNNPAIYNKVRLWVKRQEQSAKASSSQLLWSMRESIIKIWRNSIHKLNNSNHSVCRKGLATPSLVKPIHFATFRTDKIHGCFKRSVQSCRKSRFGSPPLIVDLQISKRPIGPTKKSGEAL